MAGLDTARFTVSRNATGFEMTTVLSGLTLVLAILLFLLKRNSSKLPPGPWGLPLLGYLPFFGKEAHLTFSRLRQRYGDVISIKMGSWPAVIVNGRDAIQEALVNKGDDFSGRPQFPIAVLQNEGRSIGLGPFEDVWKKQQAVVSKVLREFISSSETLLEDVVHSECNTVIDSFKTYGDESFSPKDQVSSAASSMIYQLCYGKLSNIREHQRFLDDQADERRINELKKGSLLNYMPWLRFLARNKVSQFRDLFSAVEQRRRATVAELEDSLVQEKMRGIADGLILAGRKLTAEEQAEGLDKQRVLESLDFLKQAQGSVGSALEWFILLMAAYPEVQEKVFKEIDDVVGPSRLPSLSDRNQMHYVEATIIEAIRFSSPVPLTIPHATTSSTKLLNWDIPEGTVVLFSLYSAFRDSDVWGDPDNFRPERFLTTEGQLNRSLAEEVCTFSLGRRRCLGDLLSQLELFLFITTLIQRLRLCKPPGYPEYSMSGYYNPTRKPDPFKICIELRQ